MGVYVAEEYHRGGGLSNQKQKMNNKERITELEWRIAELKSRLPRHSVPPAMLIELEELEEELQAQTAEPIDDPV